MVIQSCRVSFFYPYERELHFLFVCIGDVLVAQGAKNQSWNQLQNVNITLTYPGQGLGAQVTYVIIQVDQVKFVEGARIFFLYIETILFTELKSWSSLCGCRRFASAHDFHRCRSTQCELCQLQCPVLWRQIIICWVLSCLLFFFKSNQLKNKIRIIK